MALGYSDQSWDNMSGNEQQPWASIKYWTQLTISEKAAAKALGYNKANWDNESGTEPQPAAGLKGWAELTSCKGGEDNCLCDIF